MSTTKKKAPLKINLEAATAAATSYAQAQAAIDKKKAETDAAIAKLKGACQSFIDEKEGLKEEASEVLEAYAGEHWHEWDKGSDSLSGINYGYRKGTPAVQVDKKDEPAVIEKLKEAGLKRYLRVKYELDRPAIVKETKPSAINSLKECGVVVDQSDIFFIKLEK